MGRKRTFDNDRARAAQERYCSDHGYPLFAPPSGVCGHCGKNIYKADTRTVSGRDYTTGVSVEQAENRLITGCPHCGQTFEIGR